MRIEWINGAGWWHRLTEPVEIGEDVSTIVLQAGEQFFRTRCGLYIPSYGFQAGRPKYNACTDCDHEHVAATGRSIGFARGAR